MVFKACHRPELGGTLAAWPYRRPRDGRSGPASLRKLRALAPHSIGSTNLENVAPRAELKSAWLIAAETASNLVL